MNKSTVVKVINGMREAETGANAATFADEYERALVSVAQENMVKWEEAKEHLNQDRKIYDKIIALIAEAPAYIRNAFHMYSGPVLATRLQIAKTALGEEWVATIEAATKSRIAAQATAIQTKYNKAVLDVELASTKDEVLEVLKGLGYVV